MIPLPVKSIFFMLSYAFQALNCRDYKNLINDNNKIFREIYAAMLAISMSSQIKRGLNREYISKIETMSTIRGKVEISEYIRVLPRMRLRKQLICSSDEFSVNSYPNRIIKTTMLKLLCSEISSKIKSELKKILVFLSDVEELDVHTINWEIQYNRTNQTYQQMVWICRLILKELLPEDAECNDDELDLLERKRLHRLYENFVREYYRKEFKSQLDVSGSKIRWFVDEGSDTDFLPSMKSDITLSHKDKVLIIDTKFYADDGQYWYGKETQRSANMYQIFTYVKNKQPVDTRPVAGMLLYARTDKGKRLEHSYSLNGNNFFVKTLGLDCETKEIAEQLNKIVEEFFSISKEI